MEGKKESLLHQVVAAHLCPKIPLRCTSATVGRHVCFALLPFLQGVWVLPPVVTKFISLQELKQQHCPLAEKLLAAEKGEVLPVPAVLQGISTAVTRQTETKI